ncbi:MAG: UDP-N-acetylmuramoyl-L-alanine--D-glutamate ligase [Nitrospirota bacterium]|nr:UDP-N-acetylmuramoyl-L-alanine--D-glutamate ligase [Nitrospirota bacterium]
MQKARTIRGRITGWQRKLKIEVKDKNVTVVGLARSGIGAANLLTELGADVTVTDIKKEDELKDFIPKLRPSVRLVLGTHHEDIFLSSDMLVISPGVPLTITPISNAKARGVPIIGELELAYQIATYGSDNPPIPPIIPPHPPLEKGGKGGFLAVTGTNGKSTTTALLDFMMKKGGFETILGGNIGNALTEEILKAISHQLSTHPPIPPLIRGGEGGVDFIVSEVSSFQLESIKDFRPKVASILNITPDHLDRYHSIEEYRDAKARIFENQNEDDFLVLNWDDPETIKVASEKLKVRSEKSKIFYFSRRKEVNGIYFKNGMVYCNLPDLPHAPCPMPLIRADEIKIKGVHNLENAMAASAMALLACCPIKAVIDSLREFSGLEHRLEFVKELNGVKYFNDSKGTNIGAVIKSLESFKEPVILIAGGRDKAGDFSILRHLVRERVKAVVLIGEAGEKIKRALGDLAETVMAKDLREAVSISRNMALKGDIVLLSPACASFDMFANFEDRGMQFKKIVMEME